ncbi:hypothetical protein CAEBREN_05288 [Caenorhabditis brenneri]|uniref:F-box domain-containing protein n=1 Tax=Caenorhabditis brenneri TaxID=135651 RepID=G0N0H9_CAEBE|nr:hypothetical protein CAEBREN_05288 [Caenorhabditis brenneri]
MAAVSKFPLLQLPDKEILRTIRFLDIYRQISFSLISTRCQKLVQSLQIKAEFITATISTYILISVAFPKLNLNIFFKSSVMRNEGQKESLQAPLLVHANCFRIERNDFIYSDWLKHFQTIFHCPSIASIQFRLGSYVYDLDEIKKSFGATKKLYAQHTGCNSTNLMIFQKFLSVENLNIRPEMFQDSRIPFNILQQNYATLDIKCGNDNNPAEMTLNELLVINSKSITIENIRISPQDLNKFIKLWMKGSNSRMEHLSISFNNFVRYNITAVMKGIKHFNERSERINVHRMDIYRLDGTRATVSFFVEKFDFFVEL